LNLLPENLGADPNSHKTTELEINLLRRDVALAEMIEKYKNLPGWVSFLDLPSDMQAAIGEKDKNFLTVAVGHFTGNRGTNMRFEVGDGNALLLSHFRNHRSLMADGGGSVVLGAANYFQYSASYYGTKVSVVTTSGGLISTSRGANTLTEASPAVLPTSLADLKSRVDQYCSKARRDRSQLEEFLPDFREVTQADIKSGYANRDALVACGDLSLTYISDSTVITTGRVTVSQRISDNSKVIASEIRAQNLDPSSRTSVYVQSSLTYPEVVVADRVKLDDRRRNEFICTLKPGADGFEPMSFVRVTPDVTGGAPL